MLGKNTADAGTPIGVEGAVPNNGTGYGLSTPDDTRIEGDIESTSGHTLTVDGTPTLELGREGDDGSGTIGGGNVVGGYKDNDVQIGVVGATVGGGGNSSTSTVNGVSRDNTNEVTGDYGTVGGGYGNRATRRATIAGGGANTASGADATIGGGTLNTADGIATVGGGSVNDATALRATIAGGLSNTASGEQAAVGGGYGNEARAKSATVAGGGDFDSNAPRNVVYDEYGTIGGGDGNQAGSSDPNQSNAHATVGGGGDNTASGGNSTVGGGGRNTASGRESTVGGGNGNTASGVYGTVPGGRSNTASGSHSFAAGTAAKAKDFGAIVLADYSTNSDAILQPFESDAGLGPTGAYTFSVRATGGARIGTSVDDNGDIDAGVKVSPGSGSWASLSTRALKSNVRPVEPEAVLEEVESLAISTWEYDGQEEVDHMGPMAEDFHEQFGLGPDDKSISSVDADGVLFAAVQGLTARLEEKVDRIDELERELDRIDDLESENKQLRERNDILETRLTAIEDHLDLEAVSDQALATDD